MNAADIAIYDTITVPSANDRRSKNGKVQLIDCYSAPVELNPLYEKIIFLSALKKIKNNWNGEGAKAPSEAAINNAISFLSAIPSTYNKALNKDQIDITPYGTITMEWAKDQAHFISIEIGATKIGYFSETPDQTNPYSNGIDFANNDVIKVIVPLLQKVFSA